MRDENETDRWLNIAILQTGTVVTGAILLLTASLLLVGVVIGKPAEALAVFMLVNAFAMYGLGLYCLLSLRLWSGSTSKETKSRTGV